MIPKECKRLAEVDFPIAEVSRHSAREKSIRHGHPSTLHLWWARRPLAACRAMLLALLLPDPVDPHCPQAFKDEARAALAPPLSRPRGSDDAELRQALLKFIADFANWDAAADPVYLTAARALVKAAHGEEPPLVVDPFAGGGSIPLEALRLGCDAFASDLNPVACLILKVLLEDIPRHGPALAEELRRVGAEVKAAAEKELADFYPPDPDGARPIAYLWARTVRCEAPDCGAEIPLVRSFWLAKKEVWGRKAGKRVKLRGRQALRYAVDRERGRTPEIIFEVFEPATESDVPRGTVARAKATCPACKTVLHPERVRAQLSVQRGGADVVFDNAGRRTGGARLLAVVTLGDEERGRRYRVSTDADYGAVWRATKALKERLSERPPDDLALIPDEPTPPGGGSGAGRAFSVRKYGMLQWGDLFTARQKLALVTLTKVLAAYKQPELREYFAVVLNRVADRGSSICRWDSSSTSEVVKNTFSRQALPVVWDFAELHLFSDSTGNLVSAFDFVVNVIAANAAPWPGQTALVDGCQLPLGHDSCTVWFTDPPYYDAVPYADLSDFFFVWLRRTLRDHPLLRDPFDPTNPLTHKDREAVQDETKKFEGRSKDRSFFEERMASAFAEGRRVLREDGIGSVVFAHKTTEGWEALLSGMIRGGWVITGSWPITTEMGTRLRARESAALAASVHLVVRPRDEDAGVGDWQDIVRALPGRVSEWIDRLSNEGIRGADLVFACIGPALELYSKFRTVETADGETVGLAANPDARGEPARRGYLSYVWEAVGRAALARVLGPAGTNGGTLEEDARLTALFLWTVQSTALAPAVDVGDEDVDADNDEDDDGARASAKKGLTLVYDVARRFAQPLGIHLEQWERRIIETEKGVVRLLPVRERVAQLFGAEGAASVAARMESDPRRTRDAQQGLLFTELAAPAETPRPGRRAKGTGARRDVGDQPRDATTLDRVHAAMLLHASGSTNALRAMIRAEVERGPDFLRLANALSALYPADADEKRLVDAMLLAAPRP